jgi:amino acid transporter
MIILDFLFKICFAPFRHEKHGRFIALIWLVPCTTFALMGFANYLIFLFNSSQSILQVRVSALLFVLIIVGLFVGNSRILHRIYEINNRDIGEVKSSWLGIFILPLIVISVTLFSLSLYKFKTW